MGIIILLSIFIIAVVMTVKEIKEGMTAPEVAQTIKENFDALNTEKETVGNVGKVKESVDNANKNTGVNNYPAFSATEDVAVGVVRNYNGLLYRSIVAGANEWNEANWERVSLESLQNEKLTELASEVDVIYGLTEKDLKSGWLGDNGIFVNNGGNYYVVAVSGGDEVTIYANGNNLSLVAVVSSFNEASFSFASGFSSRWIVNSGKSDTKVMPSDAKYLLVSNVLDGNDYRPNVILVNGLNVFGSLKEDKELIRKNEARINNLIAFEKCNGWLGDNGTFVNNGGNYYVVAVSGGDEVTIYANGNNLSLVAVVSSFNEASFSFASGFSSRWIVNSGKSDTKVMPSDAKYLLVSNVLDGNDYLPKEIIVNNVNVFKNIEKIFQQINSISGSSKKTEDALFSINSIPSKSGWLGDNGTFVNNGGKYKVVSVSGGDTVSVTANNTNNSLIAVVSSLDNYGFSFASGFSSRWIVNSGKSDTKVMPSDAKYLLVSIELNEEIYTPASLVLNDYEYMKTSTQLIAEIIKQNREVGEVHCWGDSLTYAGEYEDGIANVLGLATDKVINFGLGSDYSSHIRRRMLSYYQDTTPYTGNTSSSVRPYYDGSKTLVERQQSLRDAFILIFMGTNNIIRQGARNPQYTLNSAAYKAQVMALYPEATDDNWTTFVNWDFDKAMAQAYKDYMLQDLHDMVSIIPHNHWAIITGHGINPADVNNDYLQTMEEVDKLITMTYPNNVINIKQLMQACYEYGGMSVAEDFVKPAVSSSVSIKLNTVALLSSFSGVTGGDRICIGTKKEHDTYEVESIDSANNTITAKLIENNASYWGIGDVVRAENALISDNGMDVVMLPTRVYMRMDIQSWNIDEMPRTTCQGDYVHPVNYYYAMGELIGKEIKKIQ